MTERDIIERFEQDLQETLLFQNETALQATLKELCVNALFSDNVTDLQQSRAIIIDNFSNTARQLFTQRLKDKMISLSAQHCSGTPSWEDNHTQGREHWLYIASVQTFYNNLSQGQPTDKNCALAFSKAMVPLKI